MSRAHRGLHCDKLVDTVKMKREDGKDGEKSLGSGIQSTGGWQQRPFGASLDARRRGKRTPGEKGILATAANSRLFGL